MRAPNGIRTRAAALKGRRPRPLDDGGFAGTACPWLVAVGDRPSILRRSGLGQTRSDGRTARVCHLKAVDHGDGLRGAMGAAGDGAGESGDPLSPLPSSA